MWFPILSELSLDMITFGLSLFDFITLVWEIHNRYYHVLYSSVKELHPFSYFFSTCSWTLKQLHLELKNMNRCFLAIVLCLLPWWHTGMALAEGGGGYAPQMLADQKAVPKHCITTRHPIFSDLPPSLAKWVKVSKSPKKIMSLILPKSEQSSLS